ncbi:MAG: zinc-binding dehydrogenase [Baekduiaceae bacterium]
MEQLTRPAPGVLEWRDVPEPDLQGPLEALVRPLVVATCDLDHPIATGATPIPDDVAMGHEGIAEVVAVGDGVQSVQPGDRVVIAFQISCGTCDRCRRGLTGSCQRVRPGAMYGFGALGGPEFGGFLSDLVRVPYADAMLVPLPPDLDPISVASASDNLPDAWRCVAPQLREDPTADVLVLGGPARSIGLYAAGIAVALGARRVRYADDDPGRLATASDLGAEPVEFDREETKKLKPRAGIVVDAGASGASLRCACRSVAPGGHCTHVGVIYELETPLPVLEMYSTGVTLHTGRAMARPLIDPVLGLVGTGRFHPEIVTDRVLPWRDAQTALLEPHTKLVFTRN